MMFGLAGAVVAAPILAKLPAAKPIGLSAIEINRYQTEIFDLVRRPLIMKPRSLGYSTFIEQHHKLFRKGLM